MSEYIQRFIDCLYSNLIIPVGSMMTHNKKLINVVCYHDSVGGGADGDKGLNLDAFRRQMEWLVQEGYETLRFDELNDETMCFRRKRVLIVFTDGKLSDYTEIFRYMSSLKLKFNVFLTVGEIGVNPDYMTWDMVRIMHNSRLCGFGSNSYSNIDMSDVTAIDTMTEVYGADHIFMKEMNYAPRDFCFPFGAHSMPAVRWLTFKAFYDRLYIEESNKRYASNMKPILRYTTINGNDPDVAVKNKFRGVYNLFNLFEYPQSYHQDAGSVIAQ